jgi:hypothetical protein
MSSLPFATDHDYALTETGDLALTMENWRAELALKTFDDCSGGSLSYCPAF